MPIRTPYVATDCIIECHDREGAFRGIVLITRKNPPRGLAIPGGFVEVGERVEEACVREMREETGLVVEGLRLLGVYSDPERDPRFHTVSIVYVGRAVGEPHGGDDAESAALFHPSRLPWDRLVFDHAEILRDYLDTKEPR